MRFLVTAKSASLARIGAGVRQSSNRPGIGFFSFRGPVSENRLKFELRYGVALVFLACCRRRVSPKKLERPAGAP